MKVSLKWLKEYVNVRLPVKELAHRLNMSGTEVGSIETIGGQWQNILVGRVETVEPHPNADRLKLATVDLAEERATVVCGAPNIAAGQKIAFAKVGARLIDGHSGQMVELKPATIRGVVSAGMVCSEKELGISEKHEGIMVLPPEAPVGTPLAEYLGDTIFDLDITPNRPDCLSMLGVAREVAAITYEEACLPAMRYSSRGDPIEEQVSVEIADPDLCPRYCASLVSGVKVAPSPPWMQERLVAAGMRPINN
ncbi:MAG: phenylalanine--tRNA ligase subunit beta, partial [Chloroflexi bacterium]|nr:phenylalanine--tRNA ligase subunit beta [Chloroflexota bacterium]